MTADAHASDGAPAKERPTTACVAGERRKHSDAGAGLLAVVAGVTVFLGFVLFAVQLVYNLYATSVVTSVAHDTARRVAASPEPAAEVLSATAEARDELGSRCGGDCLTWGFGPDDRNPEVVRLRVRVDNPSVLPPALAGALGFDTVDRTVTVRVEDFR